MRWQLGFTLVGGLLVSLVTTELRAACIDNVATLPKHKNIGRPFRINTQSFVQLFPNLTAQQVASAAVLAADAWNEQSSGAYFIYEGETQDTLLNQASYDCNEGYQDYSLIIARDGPAAAPGWVFGRCSEPQGSTTVYRHHELVIYKVRPNTNGASTYKYFVGQQTDSDAFDLVSVIQHELGHVIGLSHSDAGVPATMWPWPDDSGAGVGPGPDGWNIARRDLYEYDIECVADCAAGTCSDNQYGARSATGYYLQLSSSGVSFTEHAVASGIADIAMGRTYTANNGYWSSLFRDSLNSKFDEDSVAPTSVNVTPVSRLDFAQSVATRLDTPNTDRVLASSYQDFTPWWMSTGSAMGKVHKVKAAWSANGFVNTNWAYLYESAPESADDIYSSKPLALAWALTIAKPVVAWVHQTRGNLNDSSANQVRIASGFPFDSATNAYATIGIRSSVGPGIACGNGTGATVLGSYPCLIAYVDLVDSIAQVRIKGFTPTVSAGVGVSPSYVNTGLRTGSRIATWFMNGKYYIAVRSAEPMQQLTIRSSSNGGATWQTEGTGPTIITGPTVSSYLTGTDNRLSYIR